MDHRIEQAKKKRKSWGDAELDRLWQRMYEIEMSIDDMDLCDPNNYKLKLFCIARDAFNSRYDAIIGRR